MAEDLQIGGWVRPGEYRDFMRYIEPFHLRAAAAGTLLIVRELRFERLPRLKDIYPAPPGKGRKRISARPMNIGLKRAFEAHVTRLGMDVDPSVAILFRAELEERWLEQAIKMESS